ncbi:MAG: hypothetical protein IJE74_03015 [Clostridia bacterium]|nr:hypothetical protein [Clostridia bacterium]
MKRIIALFSALIMLFFLASCDKSVNPGDFEPSPVEAAQSKIIAGLGITQENSRIVAYQGTNDYVKYVVVFYENGKRTDEVTHMFYTNDIAFEKANEVLNGKSHVTEIRPEARYISYWSGVAYYGDYAQDLELVKAEYTIK